MVKVLQLLLNLFSKHKDKLPDNMDSIPELMGKAKELQKKHGDKIDDITKKIPGDADDKIVEKIKKTL